MPLLRTAAIVLGRTRLGEADRLVTFLTRARGKVKGVARGARRPKSRFAAALEPFSKVELILFIKTDDVLARVSQCDLVASRRSLREDLDKLGATSHLTNLVRALSAENDPDARFFRFFDEALDRLDGGEINPTFVLICRVRLLGLAGYTPTLDACVRCGRRIGSARVYFEPTAGGLLCDACIDPASDLIFAVPRSATTALDRARGLPLETLDRIQLKPSDRTALEKMLAAYETAVLDKRLPATIVGPARLPDGRVLR